MIDYRYDYIRDLLGKRIMAACRIKVEERRMVTWVPKSQKSQLKVEDLELTAVLYVLVSESRRVCTRSLKKLMTSVQRQLRRPELLQGSQGQTVFFPFLCHPGYKPVAW